MQTCVKRLSDHAFTLKQPTKQYSKQVRPTETEKDTDESSGGLAAAANNEQTNHPANTTNKTSET